MSSLPAGARPESQPGTNAPRVFQRPVHPVREELSPRQQPTPPGGAGATGQAWGQQAQRLLTAGSHSSTTDPLW